MSKVAKKAKKDTSDSEEERPAKLMKKSKQSDSEEEIVKPAKSTKKVKKADSGDDDEGETEKPKKGRKKAQTTKVAPVKNKTSTTYGDIDLSCTKKSASGKDWNFKISNWNVDGIRAWLKKGN